MNVFLSIVVGPGISGLIVCRTSIYIYLALLASIEKSGVNLIGLPLYITWSFPLAAFNILSLFCTLSVLLLSVEGNFFSVLIYLVFYMLPVPW